MASNQNQIINFYKDGKEENRGTESRSDSLEFHYTKKLLHEFITKDANIIEIGCATGYYGIYFSDYCSHYTGVDLSPDNIAMFNGKITNSGKKNISTFIGNATNLSEIPDNNFDVVLCLGPMYHLPHDERLRVFDECYRIARTDAILAFAYVNRLGVYAAGCFNDKWREIYPNAEANKYILENSTSDNRPGLFSLTSPEEMEHDAKEKNLEVIKNCGLDFLFAQCAIDMMSDEKFTLYMEFADKIVDSPSCTGLSNHALMICRKQT